MKKTCMMIDAIENVVKFCRILKIASLDKCAQSKIHAKFPHKKILEPNISRLSTNHTIYKSTSFN